MTGDIYCYGAIMNYLHLKKTSGFNLHGYIYQRRQANPP